MYVLNTKNLVEHVIHFFPLSHLRSHVIFLIKRAQWPSAIYVCTYYIYIFGYLACAGRRCSFHAHACPVIDIALSMYI